MLLALIFIFIFLETQSISNSEKEKINKLNSIVNEIEVALDNKDYKYALMNADNLHYTKSDSDLEREWEIKRDYYIDKVIEEAAKNDIILEEPVHEEEIPTQSETNTSSDYSSGFMDDIKSGLDDIKENIDEFNRIINGEEITDEQNKE